MTGSGRRANREQVDKWIILLDFDGTIVTPDIFQYSLRRFAGRSWVPVEDQFERGEVSLEESVIRTAALIDASKEDILKESDSIVTIRSNFGKMVAYCRSKGIRVIVASAGLDFCIRHFLQKSGCLESVEIFAPKANRIEHGYNVIFPEFYDKTSVNMKEDLVKYHQNRGKRVVYVGDNRGDYPAAKIADVAFAIKDSALATLCRSRKTPCLEITDFQQVIDVLEHSS